jgi:hypothetical protein
MFVTVANRDKFHNTSLWAFTHLELDRAAQLLVSQQGVW